MTADQEARAIYETVMPGVRGVMRSLRISHDDADRIAGAIYAGVLRYAEDAAASDRKVDERGSPH